MRHLLLHKLLHICKLKLCYKLPQNLSFHSSNAELRREHQPGREVRAVKRSELAIIKEYEKAAIDNDQKYYKIENEPITRCLSKIGPIFPAPFGRFAETGDKVLAG